MNQAGKLAGAVLVGFVALMVILIFGSMLLDEAEVQSGETQDIGFQLWEMRPLELLLLSVMMFAAVLGILKLVGGEFRWN
jgi:ABC-type Na+ efflux pump permease subunit